MKLQLRELDDLDLEEEDDEEDGASGFHHQPTPTQPSPQQHIMQRQNLGVAPTVPLPGRILICDFLVSFLTREVAKKSNIRVASYVGNK